ncbi:hypothetical protein HYPBUDRAFT_202294 [Hyphopichia burtonii NRRL Y-1933]|uniref:Dynactin subunit 4 n=1 Tax=Hyphopichia burtonii NRRL Y-1933 TaxID=984485 RepID=A0A1E4RLF1_9ASCO|nr:hypothetical protein HYPBUDRAFT_202294 [Hyphopichia burtonii NRRL Y-1933]ODV68093.1 hypothetical protein HYPBUDRAFT_202294 [Hyphopichia burtonii NRRL Y-1933]
MSRIYTNSQVFCLCSGQSVDEETKLPYAINEPGSCHQLANLLFCANCQGHKCKTNCCSFDIECKFCPNCLFDYTGSSDMVCSKNCFDCPLCDSTLSISVSDDTLDGKPGKVFKFKCLHCRYSYKTGIITKPKSLINIIKSEKKKINAFPQIYLKFLNGYNDLVTLQQLQQQLNKRLVKMTQSKKQNKHLSDNILTRMKQMNVSNVNKDTFDEMDILKHKIDSNHSIELNEDQDKLDAQQIASKSEGGGFIAYERQAKLNIDMLQNINATKSVGKNLGLFPVAKSLRAKKSYKCLNCNTPLVVPTKDPLLIKFLTKWNAIDYLPTIQITGLVNKPYPKSLRINHLEPFIINVMNPLEYDISASIFILSELSKGFINLRYDSNQPYVTQLTLPLTNFSVPGNSSSNDDKTPYIKTIPTPLLTQNTKFSRAELLMRLGKLNSQNKSVSPDESIDIENTMIEKGVNWILIPISLVVNYTMSQLSNVDYEDEVNIKIPFYITIEAKLPEEIKKLGTSKKGLKYGFWNIVDLGSFAISNN